VESFEDDLYCEGRLMPPQKISVVIGAGIVGAAIANVLSHNRLVHLFDMAPGPAHNMGTGSSSACVRRHYSHNELLTLSSFGFRFLTELQNRTKGSRIFHTTGCVSIGTKGNSSHEVYRNVFKSGGIQFEELNAHDMINRFDQLKIKDTEEGIFDESAGYADPHAVTRLLIAEAKSRSANIVYNNRIEKIHISNGKVKSIETQNGDHVNCDEVILATSFLTENLLRQSGLDLHLPPTSKRPVFTVYAPLQNGNYTGPIFADFINEIYCRPETGGILIGSIAAEDENLTAIPSDETCKIDEFRLASLLERIGNRFKVPVLDKNHIRIVNGFYDVNDADWNPIQAQIGPEGLYVSYATSGHGFKLAFAMAELLRAKLDEVAVPTSLSSVNPDVFGLSDNRLIASGVLA
jgi:glycine/D-amino acid oxidase-like deaminating enzyme